MKMMLRGLLEALKTKGSSFLSCYATFDAATRFFYKKKTLASA